MEAVRDNPQDAYPFYVKGELIRCRHCKHRIVTASIEHNDGEVTKYYMCNYWHRPTDPEGFCHVAKRARYDSD